MAVLLQKSKAAKSNYVTPLLKKQLNYNSGLLANITDQDVKEAEGCSAVRQNANMRHQILEVIYMLMSSAGRVAAAAR